MIEDLLTNHLEAGTISEWGVPYSQAGREVLVRLLAALEGPIVWAYPFEDLTIYPPGWWGRGVELERLFFVYCQDNPVKALRPLIMESTFKIVVLDLKQNLSRSDWAFLKQQARLNRQYVFVLRSYLLKTSLGNPFASSRFNVWSENVYNSFCLEKIKGKNQGRRVFELT